MAWSSPCRCSMFSAGLRFFLEKTASTGRIRSKDAQWSPVWVVLLGLEAVYAG